MTISIRLPQLLVCLVYVSCARGIMVKYGTKGGPIEPPTPEPTPPPQPYRVPAPVWEERTEDSPDPNAHWRPPFFRPQPRYTKLIFEPASPSPATSVQNFVNSYLSAQPIKAQPIKAHPVTTFFTPAQILSSQNLPGIGIRYFFPAYANELLGVKQQKKQEDAKHNDIETNDISDSGKETSSDAQWKFEKDAARRLQRTTSEGTSRPFYQWPVYIHPRH